MEREKFSVQDADEWYLRNRDELNTLFLNSENDPVVQAIEKTQIKPKSVLEIGASDGWRLESLRNKYSCKVTGVELSIEALKDAQKKYPNVNMVHGSAELIEFLEDEFDLIVMGFFLYLCNPSDLFKISYNVNDLIKDKGHLIIRDFKVKFPYKNEYVHSNGLCSYKMDYSKLFSWHPAYNLIYRVSEIGTSNYNPDNEISVDVFYKDTSFSYPNNPYLK